MATVMLSVSVDWEGQNLDGVDRVVRFNEKLPDVPLTHFVSGAYYCRGWDPALVTAQMEPGFKTSDEVGLHVHTWISLHGYPDGDKLPNYGPQGWQPWPVAFRPGSKRREDYGYTTVLSALDSGDLFAFLDVSRRVLAPLLEALEKRGIPPKYLMQGFRAGGWMGADPVIQAVAEQGFVYDASAADSALAQQASGTLAVYLAALWGPKPQSEPWLDNSLSLAATSGHGVEWRTQPFVILKDSENTLVEMPDNGMLLPYLVTPQKVNEYIKTALSLPDATFYLSVGFHQEPPPSGPDYIDELIQVLSAYTTHHDVVWLRLLDAAAAFLS